MPNAKILHCCRNPRDNFTFPDETQEDSDFEESYNPYNPANSPFQDFNTYCYPFSKYRWDVKRKLSFDDDWK